MYGISTLYRLLSLCSRQVTMSLGFDRNIRDQKHCGFYFGCLIEFLIFSSADSKLCQIIAGRSVVGCVYYVNKGNRVNSRKVTVLWRVTKW